MAVRQSEKCCAPPSRRSSRSTLVMTTYLSLRMPIERARFCGSSASGGNGLPCATSQNGQRRVQTSPRIMKLAVPLLKHSPMLGQEASSHTVCNWLSRSRRFTSLKPAPMPGLARIHCGLRKRSTRGMILIGLREVLAAPVCLLVSFIGNDCKTSGCDIRF